jgi:cytokinin dehydrogenase
VIKATLPHGLTPPVLTNYLDLSVGGTLAIGGIGGTTYRHGMQTDNVLELNVVAGDGRELTCSANLNPALFDVVRAGLGQSGIITQATLRLMPAPERARRVHLLYEDLRSFSADLRLVLAGGRFDYLQGAVLPDGAGRWKYQLEGVVFYNSDGSPDETAMLAGLADVRASAEITDLSYLEEISAFARLERLLRANGQWLNPHPWLLTFLPGSNAERIAGDILSELTPEDVGPFGRVAFYPIFTSALRTPLVRMPEESIAFIFNLVRIPTSNDRATLQGLLARNSAIYDRIRRAGGVLYPVSAFPMSGGAWKQHFGSMWQVLRESKHQYDPKGILTPGYEVF